MSVKINRKALDKLQDDLKRVGNLDLKVGIFDNPELALIARANEFGTLTIPERSFLRSTVEKHRLKYQRLVQVALRKTVEQGIDPEVLLKVIGRQVVTDIREMMLDIQTPPNAPSTIAQKGFNDPLIDSGALARGISTRIVKT